jgi:D-alanyl-D-alanine endopeptidase (penicillin-binding protein 7)
MRRLLLLASLFVLCGAGYVPQPEEFSSAIVMRPDGKVLWSFKPDLTHTAASLSKLVLALTMLHRSWNWNAPITMRAGDEVGGGRLRVSIGTRIRLGDLWQSALGSSANNAGMAMARVAGPGVSSFIKRMNAEAQRIGASSSVFHDPVGMNPNNVTTAHDMALITRAAFSQPRIVQASQQGPYTFTLAGTNITHTINNTNAPLLNDADIYLQGGKTGYLPESLYNYAAQMSPSNADGSGDAKKSVIVVVLGATSTQDGMGAAKRLAEWAWSDDEHFRVSQYPVPTKVLLSGMSGPEVKWVQEQLKVIPINGNFGPKTMAAVRAFQKAQGIAKADDSGYGVVGPATRAKLVELAP